MTPEERNIIEAAVKWHKSHQTGGLCGMSSELHLAVFAYRKSRERYSVEACLAGGIPTFYQVWDRELYSIAVCSYQEDAERIAALLNREALQDPESGHILWTAGPPARSKQRRTEAAGGHNENH